MPKDSERPSDSQAARAVRHQTMLIVFLVAMAILAWVVKMKMDATKDAENRGKKDALEFCVQNSQEHGLDPSYCYDE